MPHEYIEIRRSAGNRLETPVPPRLSFSDPLGRVGADSVDLVQVPTGREKSFQHRAFESGDQIQVGCLLFRHDARLLHVTVIYVSMFAHRACLLHFSISSIAFPDRMISRARPAP